MGSDALIEIAFVVFEPWNIEIEKNMEFETGRIINQFHVAEKERVVLWR